MSERPSLLALAEQAEPHLDEGFDNMCPALWSPPSVCSCDWKDRVDARVQRAIEKGLEAARKHRSAGTLPLVGGEEEAAFWAAAEREARGGGT